ncbi:nucleotidyltransferase domain-containing protein [Nocardiopsis aegyptia]|uniref:Polymerase nucleotidyl transferase domain-containing protein n=1 Tax=Nocardiopsis aegyptia TaxID=220378 RepID=A0A7Z0EP95_9ACTN|nr:nucleotidyltransferase domain-containing protein [Nocardiopsis aegyptia]NYJ35780.1 hypothetical protein [Nocardiopsis aegyptia]
MSTEREEEGDLVSPSLSEALKKVGVTPEQLAQAGGSVLTSGPAYLVGSLAHGLGNRGSDIDVQVFTEEAERPSPPFLFFIGRTPVDVEHYPAAHVTDVTGELSAVTVSTAVGPMACGAAPASRELRSLTRWCTALPLREGSPALLDDGQRSLVAAHRRRSVLDALLERWMAAELLAAAGHDSPHAWRGCGRALLQLAAGTGDRLAIGGKWLVASVQRSGAAESLVSAAVRVRDGSEVAGLVAELGLPDLDPWSLCRFVPHPRSEEVRLGRERYVLSAHGALHGGTSDVPADAPDARGVDAAAAVEGIGAGLWAFEIDRAAVTAALDGGEER